MISKKDVEYIANLANLEINDDDKEMFTRQISDILDYVAKLNELETDDVIPTAYTVPMKNVLREDKVEPSIPREKTLANAPNKKDGHFRVPKIISE